MLARRELRGEGWGNAWPTEVAKGRLPWPALIFRHASAGSQSHVAQKFGSCRCGDLRLHLAHGVVQTPRQTADRPSSAPLAPRGSALMDEGRFSVSAQSLYARLGTGAAPRIIDVRRAAVFGADDRMLIGALRRDPTDVGQWSRQLRADTPLVVTDAFMTCWKRAGAQAEMTGGIRTFSLPWRSLTASRSRRLPEN